MSFYVSDLIVEISIESLKNPIVEAFATGLKDKQHKHHPLAGVTIVLGSTNSGKSQFIGEMSLNFREREDMFVAQFNVLEPSVHKHSYQLSAPSMITIESLIAQLDRALKAGVDTLFIDSFRVFQYDLGGSAVSGGMATGTFKMLTQLSELCYQAGIAVIVPLNPNVKEDLLEYTARNVEGSVHNIINLDTSEFSSRDGDRTKEGVSDVESLNKILFGGSKQSEARPSTHAYAKPVYVVNVSPDPHVTTVFETADPNVPTIEQLTSGGDALTLKPAVVATVNLPRNSNS